MEEFVFMHKIVIELHYIATEHSHWSAWRYQFSVVCIVRSSQWQRSESETQYYLCDCSTALCTHTRAIERARVSTTVTITSHLTIAIWALVTQHCFPTARYFGKKLNTKQDLLTGIILLHSSSISNRCCVSVMLL